MTSIEICTFWNFLHKLYIIKPSLFNLMILTTSMENLCINRIFLLFRRKKYSHYSIASVAVSLVLAKSQGFLQYLKKKCVNVGNLLLRKANTFSFFSPVWPTVMDLTFSRPLFPHLKNDGLVLEDLELY